ncbi:DUF3040 domain-containing protein [Dactylosporangium sp. NPDC048998]|uniref:DUF3040 domain-containing protein n=1 Tax=Dactylosporangium sp. NPDC048998 TaxID=3363976 RepID=UPI003719B741
MLSDDEQWRLGQLERQLADEDPALARALSRHEPVRRWQVRLVTWATVAGGCGVPASVMAHDPVLLVVTLLAFGLCCALMVPDGRNRPALPRCPESPPTSARTDRCLPGQRRARPPWVRAPGATGVRRAAAGGADRVSRRRGWARRAAALWTSGWSA